MICFREIEIENYEQCNTELTEMFNRQYVNPTAIERFWNFPNETDFFAMCPAVINSLGKLGLTVNHVYMISISNNHPESIHIDYKANPVRLHWPIYNVGSALTKWYEYDGSYDEADLKNIDGNGPLYAEFDKNKCSVISELIMVKPTMFRVDIPHSAGIISSMPQPRVAFSFSFKEQDRTEVILNEGL
jgi:hypothetical protein